MERGPAQVAETPNKNQDKNARREGVFHTMRGCWVIPRTHGQGLRTAERPNSGSGKAMSFFSRLPHWRGPRTGGKGTQAGCRETQQVAQKNACRAVEGVFSRLARMPRQRDPTQASKDQRGPKKTARRASKVFGGERSNSNSLGVRP